MTTTRVSGEVRGGYVPSRLPIADLSAAACKFAEVSFRKMIFF